MILYLFVVMVVEYNQSLFLLHNALLLLHVHQCYVLHLHHDTHMIHHHYYLLDVHHILLMLQVFVIFHTFHKIILVKHYKKYVPLCSRPEHLPLWAFLFLHSMQGIDGQYARHLPSLRTLLYLNHLRCTYSIYLIHHR